MLGASVKPVEKSGATAVQSAAMRATGNPTVATPINKLRDHNPRTPSVCFFKSTLGEVPKVDMLK